MTHNDMQFRTSPSQINRVMKHWWEDDKSGYCTTGRTILQRVILKGLWSHMPYLLKQGANVRQKGEMGETILHDVMCKV